MMLVLERDNQDRRQSVVGDRCGLVDKGLISMIVWRGKWQPTLVLLPGKFHGWKSLVSYGSWDRKESDTTEQLHFHFK